MQQISSPTLDCSGYVVRVAPAAAACRRGQSAIVTDRNELAGQPVEILIRDCHVGHWTLHGDPKARPSGDWNAREGAARTEVERYGTWSDIMTHFTDRWWRSPLFWHVGAIPLENRTTALNGERKAQNSGG